MNQSSKIFWQSLKILKRFSSHISIMNGVGIDAHQFRYDANSSLEHGFKFLTAHEMIKEIQKNLRFRQEDLKGDSFVAKMLRHKSPQRYHNYCKDVHIIIKDGRRNLIQIKNNYSSNKNIFIYQSPISYRLLNKSDLPLIKVMLLNSVCDNDTIKGNIYLLIHSQISAYKIDKYANVSQSIISGLRNHKREIGNLALNTAIRLSDYSEKSTLVKHLGKLNQQAISKIRQSIKRGDKD